MGSIKLKSETQNINLIEPFLHRELDVLSDKAELFSNILLATIEAVSNGMKHGNRYEANKEVRVDIELASGLITIRVEDEGEGFDYLSIPDPLSKERLEAPNGRGLFIMHKYADEIAFCEGGRQVRMVFKY